MDRRQSESSVGRYERFLAFLRAPGGSHVPTSRAPVWDSRAKLDAYTLMFLASVRSRSFLFSVMIFALQMSMLVLTLIDQLKQRKPFNFLNIPINNPPEVVVAQFLSLIVLALLQEHSISTITVLMAFPPDKIRIADYTEATRCKWLLGNVCRLLVHLASLAVSFVFIVQNPTVIDIFKDFAAIQFVTELSHLGFFCAQCGFFGKQIKLDACYAAACKHVNNDMSVEGLHARGEAQVAGGKFVEALSTYQEAVDIAPEDQKRASQQKFNEAKEQQVASNQIKETNKERLTGGTAFLVLGAMVTVWSVLVAYQKSKRLHAKYACRRIDVQLGNGVYDLFSLEVTSPFHDLKKSDGFLLNLKSPPALQYPYFSGIYTISWEDIIDNRPVYFEHAENDRRATAGKFHYCAAEKVWVFKLGEFDDGVERGACGQWLLRSGPTKEFLLEGVSSDWSVWTGSVHSISTSMKCMDCSKSVGNSGCNFNGECHVEDGRCWCNDFPNTTEKWFGEGCQAPPPCLPVDVFVHGETSADYHQVAHFMPLKDNSGKRVLAQQRPVYWNKRNMNITKQNFLLYTGSRWYHTDWPISKMCPDNPECRMGGFAHFFTDKFHAYWSNTRLDSTKYVSEETRSFTPVGLSWLSLEQENQAQGDFGPFGYTVDEDVSTHCFKVNDYKRKNLCGKNGVPVIDSRYSGYEAGNRKRCECKNGSSGYFCQFSPNNSYVVNQINSSDPCNEFFCDYLDDQKQIWGDVCSTQCTETRQLKACWNTPDTCVSDPADRS